MVKKYPRNWRRTHILVEGGIYHIIARGNNKKPLFSEEVDYLFFKTELNNYKRKYSSEVLAYCLMTNHYHLLLKSGPQLPRLMHAFSIKYAKYINAKYKSTGHLFEDRYKSFLVADDPYLITLIRYIHNNPVRAGLVEDPSVYRHSSLVDYSKGSLKSLTDTNNIRTLFDINTKNTSIAHVLS